MNSNKPRPATTEQHEWIRALTPDARERLILPPTYDAAERHIERLFISVEAVKDEVCAWLS
jgi:hypothetical protein